MQNTLFVVDTPEPLKAEVHSISFNDYLKQYPKRNEPKMRVINLCDTNGYLSQGYYCSLLAEARNHQVIPSVKVINELRCDGAPMWLEKKFLSSTENRQQDNIIICMGEVEDQSLVAISQKIFQSYPAPILTFSLSREAGNLRVVIKRCSLSQLSEQQTSFCLQVLNNYSKKSWHSRNKGKKFRWDMAMLVNPEEQVPPSNKGALTRFIKAGEKLGIRVHQITSAETPLLNQFDALFIRETTAIDHYTYGLVRKAENLGLVVIDDSTSILRCCNKVFLQDAFSYKKIPCLQSAIINELTEATIIQLEAQLGYPMVLKMPESSFSKGVFKVTGREELKAKGTELLANSALVLAQEYMFTDFDWRIGVLNGRAIYACRYYMAKNHWQIYNHSSKRFFTGGFDSLPTFEVPTQILHAATKAAAAIGNGFYGIDLKQNGKQAYVIEVNDNPNIDYGVEDVYLGEELYMQIMSEFLRRLEARGL
jgi:glutathione synthase/RimK-type ligase-like ATP-grasp enzyme